MHLDRAATLARLRAAQPCSTDVLIVGGGINGAGLLRELALNGIDALLVDQADFAAGATSASSRMIHGGLRYLENGEFRLVREALHERNRLLKHAAHAVKPLPTTIPIFSRWSGFVSAAKKFLSTNEKPSKRGAALIKIGLTLYDIFAGRDRVLPRHKFSSRAAALRKRPQLHPGIVCTATYYDAWVSLPERLCLELIDDACALHPGAGALNYCGAVRAEGGEVILRETVSGAELRVRPRAVVNATGAWIDFTDGALGEKTAFIGGTKGSHLVLDHAELFAATQGEEIYFENEDGRICLFFPIHGKVLVGTTDLRIDEPGQAVCDEREIGYILDSITHVFPALRVSREHIVSHFCGVRPLPRTADGYTGAISRDHHCEILPPKDGRPWPVYALVGGKWTTFRAFAEQVTDKLLGQLGRTRRADSRDLAIGGREPEPDYLNNAALGKILATEAVVHLDDLLLRRTPLALYGFLDGKKFTALAALAAATLGWDAARLAEETARARRILAERHGIRLPAS
jgi:glycerol-3-phosphate dehydrogenase